MILFDKVKSWAGESAMGLALVLLVSIANASNGAMMVRTTFLSFLTFLASFWLAIVTFAFLFLRLFSRAKKSGLIDRAFNWLMADEHHGS